MCLGFIFLFFLIGVLLIGILNVFKGYGSKFWIGYHSDNENGLGVNILEHIDGENIQRWLHPESNECVRYLKMFIQHLDKYLEGSYFSLEDFLILLENSNYELNLEEIEKIKNVIKIFDFESIESYILWLRNNYSKLAQGDYPIFRTTFGILYQYEKNIYFDKYK